MVKSPEAAFEIFVMSEASVTDLRIGGLARIAKNIQAIRSFLTETGRIAVLSSGSGDSLNTASILLENPWISAHSTNHDVILAESLSRIIRSDDASTFLPSINQIASEIAANMDTSGNLGMIMVAEADVIDRMPGSTGLKFDEAPDTNPLALNHLTVDLSAIS